MSSSDAGANATAPGPAGPGGPPLDLSKLPHDSLQANIVFAAVICWLISFGAVIARFYTRRVIVRVVGATDWCILVACVRITKPLPLARGLSLTSLARRADTFALQLLSLGVTIAIIMGKSCDSCLVRHGARQSSILCPESGVLMYHFGAQRSSSAWALTSGTSL